MGPVTIVGRKSEIAILEKALISSESELIAVTGRRRIGKTFLITQTYQKHFAFDMVGTQNASLDSQLQNFADQLSFYTSASTHRPTSWQEAFKVLRQYLETQTERVIFFDELPWLSTPKSGFLEAFSYFWNSWACRKNLKIVICGSAASWIIQKIVNDKGGLHNRITKHIHLEPFTLSETEAFLQSRRVFFDRYQIIQLYMAIGGIPHYLKEIEATKSVVQNIDALCFTKNGLLGQEFNRLYQSLFTHADKHILVVRTLAQKKMGMTRQEIADKGKMPNGGGLTQLLDELQQSGFIGEYVGFGKKNKEKLYRLTDEYSLFYLKFIEPSPNEKVWQQLSQTPAYKTWSGYTFESICLKHLDNIKKVLGISGIYVQASSFYRKGSDKEKGCQIDMLLDRNDATINLFEIKFYNQPYTFTKADAEDLQQKMWCFRSQTQTRKQLTWVFINSFGLVPNQYSMGLVTNALTLEDLF